MEIVFYLVVLIVILCWFGVRATILLRQRQRDLATLETYRRSIAAEPRNIGAYEGLADGLRRIRRLEEARAAYEQIITEFGETNVSPTRYKLRQVNEEIAEAKKLPNPMLQWLPRLDSRKREGITCPYCGASNSINTGRCPDCDSLLDTETLWGAVIMSWRHQKSRASMIDMFLCIIVICTIARLVLLLPTDIAGAIFMATAIVVTVLFFRSLGGSRVG